MSQLVPITDQIKSLAEPFAKLNTYELNFAQEAMFAKQQVTKSDYIFQAAQKSPQSLQGAILNVSAIGVSLNPALKHAYLVPRDGAICLDISYLGLVKLATDAGAIEWAKAELVYEGDIFRWRGMTETPQHEFDPFESDRMDIKDPFKRLRGGYCIAKLTDGTLMVDRMTADELAKIRDTSKAAKGPWKTWPEEMMKKSLVKRASKSWPQGAGRGRIDTAIDVLNQHEGIEQEEPVDETKVIEFLNLVATGRPVEVLTFMNEADDNLQAACYNTAPKGEKVKFKERVKGMLNEAHGWVEAVADEITQLAEAEDLAALQHYDELDDMERALVDAKITDTTHRQIEAIRRESE